MISIREYNYFKDYRMLEAWYSHYDMDCPLESMFPKGATFIAEYNTRPMACLSILYTNVNAIAFIENLVSDPRANKQQKTETVKVLLEYAAKVAASNKVTMLMGMTRYSALADHVKEYGYQPVPAQTVIARRLR